MALFARTGKAVVYKKSSTTKSAFTGELIELLASN